ncbi:MAG: hypothetical protein WA985_09070 [Erythrobacter sp.]|uniref:hypothetical protein n=1 Tax=Erythrobacter sp. TaxID=1042 RepID=UPI003C77F6C2
MDPLLTFAMALAFCAIHVFVGKLRFLDVKPRSRWLSFAGGVAVGYVFLHILPELAAHSETVSRATGLDEMAAEQVIYLLALVGLASFYGIERELVLSRGEREGDNPDAEAEAELFWPHIGLSAVLVMVIAYLLNHREDPTATGLALYFGAMALHFVTADFGTRSNHRALYDSTGRWVLVAATLAGWATGVLVALPELLIGCLFAFLAGAITLVVLKEELPEDRRSRFIPFAAGGALYAGLVVLERVTAH